MYVECFWTAGEHGDSNQQEKHLLWWVRTKQTRAMLPKSQWVSLLIQQIFKMQVSLIKQVE